MVFAHGKRISDHQRGLEKRDRLIVVYRSRFPEHSMTPVGPPPSLRAGSSSQQHLVGVEGDIRGGVPPGDTTIDRNSPPGLSVPRGCLSSAGIPHGYIGRGTPPACEVLFLDRTELHRDLDWASGGIGSCGPGQVSYRFPIVLCYRSMAINQRFGTYVGDGRR